MHIFLNALGANTASGLTYLRNVLPQFAAHEDLRTTVAMDRRVGNEFCNLRNVQIAELPKITGTPHRFWFEQIRLPAQLKKIQADVLVSTGNFALRKAPIPQILLSGNSLYTSRDFYRDLLARREYRLWFDTRVRSALAKKSVHWADCTIAPSRAFAGQLSSWTGAPVVAIHHGFDPGIFFSNDAALGQDIRDLLDSAHDELKLLYVSHYNYFRNFETLFRALPHIQRNLNGKKVKLFLTCKLQPGGNPGLYRTKRASDLLRQLAIEDDVIQLGSVPYGQLHHLYRACDIYVTPSYAETFAHPLVEAQACGLPVVASDLAVHREVCGERARYFGRFSPEELAEKVLETVGSGSPKRSYPFTPFSWRQHVHEVISVASQLLREQMIEVPQVQRA